FTGMESETPFMINLMLDLGEEPEMFGETIIHEINESILNILLQMGTNVSQNYDLVNQLKLYMKSALFLLERLKNLTKEQRLAQIYVSEKARTILEILQERPLSRKELKGQLEEKINKVISNIEITLDPFVKTGLIKQDWVEGVSDISLFLLTDFTFFRTPVTKLIEDARKNLPTPTLATKYIEAVTKFFTQYQPTFEDNFKIAQSLMNPDKYDYITLFRERAYPINKIPRGPGESTEEIGGFLKDMVDDNIIIILKDEKNVDWILLFTDIAAYTFYPEYMIEKIRKDSTEGKLKRNVAIKHLEFLEETYKK
ncbi:MAG: hypothetical protein ACFFCC_17265, partial [Promethearchaeota archaeon]